MLLTGSQFAESVLNMDRHEREHAILDQLAAGNLPGFLRKLVPVKLDAERWRKKAQRNDLRNARVPGDRFR